MLPQFTQIGCRRMVFWEGSTPHRVVRSLMTDADLARGTIGSSACRVPEELARPPANRTTHAGAGGAAGRGVGVCVCLP